MEQLPCYKRNIKLELYMDINYTSVIHISDRHMMYIASISSFRLNFVYLHFEHAMKEHFNKTRWM